jgi:hypothetical protein
VQIVNLATCTQSKLPLPKGAASPLTVRVTRTSQSIVYRGRVVLTIHESHKVAPAGIPGPIELFGLSPDRHWVLYAIDPQGSASLLRRLDVRARRQIRRRPIADVKQRRRLLPHALGALARRARRLDEAIDVTSGEPRR